MGHGSNKNYIKDVGDFSKNNYAGRNFYYGIREHAMGAILNGLSFYGLFRPSGSTFLVFSDYMRSSVRVAALSHIPVGYIWTHDSIGAGEDGPTHQPVETVSSLRLIPNLNVQRPGDAEETAGSYIHGMNHKTGPTAYILSDAYKAKILPAKAKTTAIEAGATGLWYKYADKVLGVDTFGESAPAPLIFEKKGITAANLAKVASA